MTTPIPTSARTTRQAARMAEELRHLDEYAREDAIDQKLRLKPGTAEILLAPPCA